MRIFAPNKNFDRLVALSKTCPLSIPQQWGSYFAPTNIPHETAAKDLGLLLVYNLAVARKCAAATRSHSVQEGLQEITTEKKNTIGLLESKFYQSQRAVSTFYKQFYLTVLQKPQAAGFTFSRELYSEFLAGMRDSCELIQNDRGIVRSTFPQELKIQARDYIEWYESADNKAKLPL